MYNFNLDAIDWTALRERRALAEFNQETRAVLAQFVKLPLSERVTFFDDFPEMDDRAYLAKYLETSLMDICRDGLCIQYAGTYNAGPAEELRVRGYMRTHRDEATKRNFALPTNKLLMNMQMKFNKPNVFSASKPDARSIRQTIASGITSILQP